MIYLISYGNASTVPLFPPITLFIKLPAPTSEPIETAPIRIAFARSINSCSFQSPLNDLLPLFPLLSRMVIRDSCWANLSNVVRIFAFNSAMPVESLMEVECVLVVAREKHPSLITRQVRCPFLFFRHCRPHFLFNPLMKRAVRSSASSSVARGQAKFMRRYAAPFSSP